MTSTTTRPAAPQPVWPSRREREGGTPIGAPRPVIDVPRPVEPVRARHAVPEPVPADAVQQLPVIPRQRVSPPAAPVVAGPATTGRAPFRPVLPTPRPPRPSVGSGVRQGIAATGHRVDGQTRAPRNGLGLAALCLGLVALPLGLLPVSAFLAAGLGVLALAFGVAGWSRTRSGVATNTGSAIVGSGLGLLAVVIGVAGTLVFFADPTQPVYDLDALVSSVSGSTIGE